MNSSASLISRATFSSRLPTLIALGADGRSPAGAAGLGLRVLALAGIGVLVKSPMIASLVSHCSGGAVSCLYRSVCMLLAGSLWTMTAGAAERVSPAVAAAQSNFAE